MSVTETIDTVLDRTIVLGYGDVGPRIRRHLRRRLWDLGSSLLPA